MTNLQFVLYTDYDKLVGMFRINCYSVPGLGFLVYDENDVYYYLVVVITVKEVASIFSIIII